MLKIQVHVMCDHRDCECDEHISLWVAATPGESPTTDACVDLLDVERQLRGRKWSLHGMRALCPAHATPPP